MKTNIYYLAVLTLFVLITFPHQAISQNMILAGQTEGEYIHYTDYDPDMRAELPWGYEDFFVLDVNSDGVDDLKFRIMYLDNWPFYYEFRSDVILLNDGIKVARNTNGHAKAFSLGDTINESLMWYGNLAVALALKGFHSDWETNNWYYFGEFDSDYLGFKVITDWEDYFGWIDIETYVTTLYIVAKSMAFYSQTVSVENIEKTSNQLTIFPNPCQEKFNIQFPEMNGDIGRFHISDINGRRIKDGIITGQTTEIDVSDLNPGVYFIEVYEDSKTTYRSKVLIQ